MSLLPNDFEEIMDEIHETHSSWEYLKNVKSPLMEQYVACKEQYASYIVLFQVGGFFETYASDAEYVSKKLELKLTGKEIMKTHIPMCGFPIKEGIQKANQLAQTGNKVVLFEEQKENDIVKRVFSRIITPATITDEEFLKQDEHQYMMTAYEFKNELGIAMVDILSGEVITRNINKYAIFDMISRFQPKQLQVYLTKDWEHELVHRLQNAGNVEICKVPYFFEDLKEKLQEHKEQHFTQEFIPYSVIGAHYFLLSELDATNTSHVRLRPIHYAQERDYLYIHQQAIAGLELLENNQNRKKEKSLFGLLDKTSTPKGSRLLKKWIQEPLIEENEIKKRHNLVHYFVMEKELREKLQNVLEKMVDFERVMARIETQKSKEKDLVLFLQSIEVIQEFFQTMNDHAKNDTFQKISFKNLEKLNPILQEIQAKINKETVISTGYNEEYDTITLKKNNGLYDMETYTDEIKEQTDIKTLKLSYNKVLGYHFEITKSHFSKIPNEFIVKKELSSSKQCITETLVSLEEEYMDALEKYDGLRLRMFRQIAMENLTHHPFLRSLNDMVSYFDVLLGFATLAEKYHYQKPTLSSERNIMIQNGIHPLLQAFNYKKVIPNHCHLQHKDIQIVSGPNMGGKSTYLKMVALNIVMAQIGSFVPSKLCFSPVDRILVRIGANDSTINNQSTFMVEMEEVAYILYHATENSLVIMDELGRGTSTNDGISIAHAVVKYVHNTIQCNMLCSTHYHELNELENKMEHIHNYHAEAIEEDGEMKLTYKIQKGGSSNSFGIEVAKKVGLPPIVIETAENLLQTVYKKK